MSKVAAAAAATQAAAAAIALVSARVAAVAVPGSCRRCGSSSMLARTTSTVVADASSEGPARKHWQRQQRTAAKWELSCSIWGCFGSCLGLCARIAAYHAERAAGRKPTIAVCCVERSSCYCPSVSRRVCCCAPCCWHGWFVKFWFSLGS